MPILMQEWQIQTAKGITKLSFNDWLEQWIITAQA